MTATDELRAELTRRGVKWKRMRGHKHDGTEWHDASGAHVSAVQEYTWDCTEWPDGSLHVSRGAAWLTPEQAVDMTLGRGECELTDNGPWGYPYVCSACGASFDADVNGGDFNYCPNCGRRVVSE